MCLRTLVLKTASGQCQRCSKLQVYCIVIIEMRADIQGSLVRRSSKSKDFVGLCPSCVKEAGLTVDLVILR